LVDISFQDMIPVSLVTLGRWNGTEYRYVSNCGVWRWHSGDKVNNSRSATRRQYQAITSNRLWRLEEALQLKWKVNWLLSTKQVFDYLTTNNDKRSDQLCCQAGYTILIVIQTKPKRKTPFNDNESVEDGLIW